MSALIPYSDFSSGLLVPINPLWLKPVHVESCLVSVHCPELLTRSGKGALHKALCLQLKHSVFILSSGKENTVTYCTQHPTCVRFRQKRKCLDEWEEIIDVNQGLQKQFSNNRCHAQSYCCVSDQTGCAEGDLLRLKADGNQVNNCSYSMGMIHHHPPSLNTSLTFS